LKIFLLALVTLSLSSFITKVVTENELKSTVEYWTKENLEKAVPMEQLISQDPSFLKALPESIEKIFQDKNSLKADTEYVRPESLYQEFPYKTIGKFFFRFQGNNAYCSASSSGHHAILTAGHCIWLQGNFHTDFLFIPQFNNGTRPVGAFAAKEVMIFEEWKDGNFARDVAFAISIKVNGKSLEETVGKLTIGSCDVADGIRAFGYPGPDYGGEKLVTTVGDVQRRFPLSPWEPAPLGIRSKMGPGSSGGPWIAKFKGFENIACSVNSFGVRFTYYVFGPFFDEKVFECDIRNLQFGGDGELDDVCLEAAKLIADLTSSTR